MLIVTARIPRRRLMAGGVSVLCCCLVLVVALVLSLNGGAVPTSASVSGMKDNSARVTYLQQRGWTVGDQAVSTQELLIPDTLDESYDSYQTLQRQQGFDLENYCGQRVQRYVYPISNHPTGRSDVQAVLLVCDGTLIGDTFRPLTAALSAPWTSPPHRRPRLPRRPLCRLLLPLLLPPPPSRRKWACGVPQTHFAVSFSFSSCARSGVDRSSQCCWHQRRA